MLRSVDLDPTLGGPPPAFTAFAALVGVLIVVSITIAVHRAVRLAGRGVNPSTLQEDLATRALRSEALAPSRTKSERLAELDAVHRDGSISDAEREAARARILAE